MRATVDSWKQVWPIYPNLSNFASIFNINWAWQRSYWLKQYRIKDNVQIVFSSGTIVACSRNQLDHSLTKEAPEIINQLYADLFFFIIAIPPLSFMKSVWCSLGHYIVTKLVVYHWQKFLSIPFFNNSVKAIHFEYSDYALQFHMKANCELIHQVKLF